MSPPFFSTPADVRDYSNEANYQKWSQFIGDAMNDTISVEEQTVGKGKCQFYNPETKPAVNRATVQVTWNGFPRRLQLNNPNNFLEVADKKDGWPFNDQPNARNQDEYLEWFVHKNALGKITRIDFTSEGPEYWDYLFQWEPKTCLALYQKYVSPDVKLEDLYTVEKGQKVYNTYNRWNTTHGCMHLNCPPNSLGAEIRLAGDASIIRKKNGAIVTDSQELINCSKYGRADRNSDPHIGSACNTLCRDGQRISLANPVCLFIADVKLAGWTTPKGQDASGYMKLIRGTDKKGLRYTLEVPASDDFTVGDIMIAGEPIQYGGSIALLMDVGLVAEACKDDNGAQPAYPCVPDYAPKMARGAAAPAGAAAFHAVNIMAFSPSLQTKKHFVSRGYNQM